MSEAETRLREVLELARERVDLANGYLNISQLGNWIDSTDDAQDLLRSLLASIDSVLEAREQERDGN